MRLAVLGGAPAFPDGLAFARPAAPPLDAVLARLAPSYEQGMLTNGAVVRELEARAAEHLQVRHAVAVSSCTAGLMLALQALVERPGPVVMPSFTFSATAHAATWIGATPRFAECGPHDVLLDVDDAARRMDGAVALVATHVFGAPCHPEALEALAAAHGVPLVFDAAHGLGSIHAGRPVGGFGDVEVFSLSPTKLVVAGEGGLVATDDDALAARIRIGRDYGNPGTYDTAFAGLNARMSELHAAVAIESLADLTVHVARRNTLVSRYAAALAGVPGVRLQHVAPGDRSSYKDVTIFVDADELGVDRDVLAGVLRAEGIDTRRYFSPPVHRHEAYRHLAPVDLPVTDRASSQVLSLPLWRDLPDDAVDTIGAVIAEVGRDPGALATTRRSA
ncbi:MAG: DegT/DnrJ/EryC1/StrS family aminotransferase [Ilumatobacteraceae bacterium]